MVRKSLFFCFHGNNSRDCKWEEHRRPEELSDQEDAIASNIVEIEE